ncbi:phosphoglycolate phosphatase [Donghicola sp. XS_ASV15]|uniref:phosphoglycolate phosphatase n=1 Tax=Donghicola sp. XS_ASV15 TaxID=3241295 RepID=UPI0035175D83
MARIIFDLDGTLIDSAPDIQAVANGVLGAEGYSPITLEQTRSFIGNGAPTFVARMRAARDIPDSEQGRLLTAFKIGYVSAVDLTVIYDGVVDALCSLRDQGHKLGICTNKPFAATEAILKHLDLASFFDAVVGGDTLPHHKPDPAMLFAAADAMGEGAILYVGDSEVDAETARRADLPFLLYTAGYHKTDPASIPKTASFDSYSSFVELVARTLPKS